MIKNKNDGYFCFGTAENGEPQCIELKQTNEEWPPVVFNDEKILVCKTKNQKIYELITLNNGHAHSKLVVEDEMEKIEIRLETDKIQKEPLIFELYFPTVDKNDTLITNENSDNQPSNQIGNEIKADEKNNQHAENEQEKEQNEKSNNCFGNCSFL